MSEGQSLSEERDKPWFAEYNQFGISKSLEPYPDRPVHSLLYDAAENHPEQGVVQQGCHYTYPELADHVDRVATALRERGVEKGSRVATVLPTSVQFLIVTQAISRAGGVHIPNDFLDAEEDLVYRLERGDPEVLIGHDKHLDLIRSLQAELDLEDVILTTVEDYSADPPENLEPVEDGEWFRNIIERTEPDPPDVTFDVEKDVHTLLFTGGTTGLPKGCLLTHRNILANTLQAVAAQSRMAELMRGQEAGLMALPMYHAYGYTVSNTLLELGMDVLMAPDARDTEAMIDLIKSHEPIIMLGVPTQFMELVDEELDMDMVGISGSAPLATETKEEFERKSKGVSQGYGLSEMSPVTHFNVRGLRDMMMGAKAPEDDAAFEQPTIGIPVPDTDVKLVDVDSGEEIPIEDAVEKECEGELYLNGPQRMKGYLDNKKPFDDEGFIATGDIAKVDARGRFYIVDRVKNMINVSGLKVYSQEVDEVLYGMEGVERPATIGVPDPDRPGSEQVKVFIETEPAYRNELTADDVREFLDGEVPKQAIPDEVEFLDEIPLTDIGKTDKKALEERHEQGA